MACYDELCDCFERDDCEGIKGLIYEYTISSVLPVAASYSAQYQQLSDKMTREIIQAVMSEIEMHHAIWMFDEMINGKEILLADDSILLLIESELLAYQEEDSAETRVNRQQLVQYIELCSDSEFGQFLSSISDIDVATAMSGSVILATIERARRLIDDDRVFFLVLHSAYMTTAFGLLLMNVAMSQDETLGQFQEQEYETEIIPQFNPSSGTEWAAAQPRRHHGRRRMI